MLGGGRDLGWSALTEESPEVSDPLSHTSLICEGDQHTLPGLCTYVPGFGKGAGRRCRVPPALIAAVLKRSTPPPPLQDRLVFDVQGTEHPPGPPASATDPSTWPAPQPSARFLLSLFLMGRSFVSPRETVSFASSASVTCVSPT